MPSFRPLIALSLLGFLPVPAVANSPASDADIDRAIVDAQIAAREAAEARTKEISIGCNVAPLSTTPVGPTWTLDVNENFMGRVARFEMIAWRKPCPTEGDFQLMLTLRPSGGPTALFSPFAVAQGGRTFNVMPVVNEANTAFSGNLATTTTVMLQYIGPQAQAFDDEQALTIKVLSLGGDTLNLEIPSAVASEPPTFSIDGRVRGSFYDPATSGQGFLLDYVPGATPMLAMGWYTASPDPQKEDQHEWFTLIGPITGDTATLDIHYTTGQRFMTPSTVTTTTVGTATVTFDSCTRATLQYSLPGFEKAGTVTLQRLTPAPSGCN